MVTVPQHWSDKVTRTVVWDASSESLEHLQRGHGECSGCILRVLEQGGWNRILERTKLVDGNIFMSAFWIKCVNSKWF